MTDLEHNILTDKPSAFHINITLNTRGMCIGDTTYTNESYLTEFERQRFRQAYHEYLFTKYVWRVKHPKVYQTKVKCNSVAMLVKFYGCIKQFIV